MGYKVKIGLSNKHVHLQQDHIDILFGKGQALYNLEILYLPE